MVWGGAGDGRMPAKGLGQKRGRGGGVQGDKGGL